jgi:hypothetical protein
MPSILIEYVGYTNRIKILSGYPTVISLNERTCVAVETPSGIQLRILEVKERDDLESLTKAMEKQIRQRIDDIQHLSNVHSEDTVQLMHAHPDRPHDEILRDMDINSQIVRNHIDALDTYQSVASRTTRTVTTSTNGKVYDLMYDVPYTLKDAILSISKYTFDDTIDLDLPENHEVICTETTTKEDVCVCFSREIKSQISEIVNAYN